MKHEFPEHMLVATRRFSGGRIYEKMIILWEEPPLFRKMMEELLEARERVNPKTGKTEYGEGFPFEVASELLKVFNLHKDLYHLPGDTAWKNFKF